MASYQTMVLTIPDTAAQFQAQVGLVASGTNNHDAMTGLTNYLRGMNGGLRSGSIAIKSGATYATATMTVSSTGSANDETCSVCNVTFTAKTSGATGNQFNISTTAATQASNMATAFNASADLTGIVTAQANGAVVTLTSVIPGYIGNGLQVSDSLTNVATSGFVTVDSGSDGTDFTINLT